MANPWEMDWGASTGKAPWEQDWGGTPQAAPAPPAMPATVTGADAMRARGLTSPDPAAANAATEQAMKGAMAERFVRDNPIGARAAKFNQGLPFIGEYVDEALGVIGGPAAREHTRALSEAMDTARPKESMAWQLGGGVTGSIAALPAAIPGAGAIGSIPGLGLRTVAAGTAGLGAGALEGAVSGYGAGNDGDRLAEAGRRALIGGGTGLAVGAATPAIGKGVSALWGRLKGRDVAAIARELNIKPDAARAVKAALDADNFDPAAISRGGPNAMLLEAGPATTALGDAAAQSGGAAGRIMREATDARSVGGAADFRGAVDDAFRPGTAVIPKPPKVGSVYDKAYRTPIDYSSDAGRKIEALMGRVEPSVVAKARRMIEMDISVPDEIKQQMLISIQPDGTLKKGILPSVMELDYVTRALNDAGKGIGVMGGKTNEGRIYGNLSKAIRDQVKEAVPAYRQALDLASTEIGIKEARDFGATILRPGTTRRDVAEMLVGAPEAERLAAKAELRQAVDDQLANTKRLLTRPNTDVNEAIRGIKDMSTRAARDKLAVVLGKEEAEKLGNALDEAATAFEIQAAMAGNSKTAVRQAIQGSIDKSASPNVVSRLMAGEPLQATKRLVQLFTGSTPEAQEAVKAGIYEDIARALTEKKGPAAERALVGIQAAMAKQPLTEAEAKRLSAAVTSALTIGGYQTGTRALQSR